MSNTNCCDSNLASNLACNIGETITIFTTSGGQSGCGFTGVVLKATPCFIRLLTCIGSPPACALGNGCTQGCYNNLCNFWECSIYDGFCESRRRRFGCCNRGAGQCFRPIRTVGSQVDIPIDKIAAIVRNTL